MSSPVANLTFTSVSADGTQSTLTDSTTYGGSITARNLLAISMTAYKVDESNVETALVVASFDPKTATIFTVTNTIDGRYRFYFVIINDWSGGTTYNQYDMVWSVAQTAFYQYINVTPSAGHAVTDPTYFILVGDPTSIIRNVGTPTASGNLIYQVLEKIIDFKTAKCYADLAVICAKEQCGDDDDCECKSRNGRAKKKIRVLLADMRISDTRQQYLQGERFAREAEHYCTDCGCMNR